MNLLDNFLKRAESKEEEPNYQPKINLTELVRTCVQCDFSFVQSIDEILQCVCPKCKKVAEERANARNSQDETPNLPVQVLPLLPSVAQVIESLKKL